MDKNQIPQSNINQNQKPSITCKKCNTSNDVVEIVYGRPSEELQKKAQRGEVILGGCCPEPHDYHCKKCNLNF